MLKKILLSFVTVAFILSAQTIKPRVGIIPFVAKNASGTDAEIIEELFRGVVVNSGMFEVLDRNNMDTILKEQEFQQTGCTDSDCAVQVGRLLNMQFMFYGSLMKLGSSYIISVGMVNVETGQIVKTAQRRFAKIDDAYNELTAVVNELSGKEEVEPAVEPKPEPVVDPEPKTKVKDKSKIFFISSAAAFAGGGAFTGMGMAGYSAADTFYSDYENAYDPTDAQEAWGIYEDELNSANSKMGISFGFYAAGAGLLTVAIIQKVKYNKALASASALNISPSFSPKLSIVDGKGKVDGAVIGFRILR